VRIVVIERQAARVVLVADGRVLLQQGFDPGRPEAGSWWLTPGGGLNDGESVEDGAVREVLEETGLRLSPAQLGPVIATRVAYFEFEHRQFRQSESFFAVDVETFTPQHHGWDEVEQRALLDHRWWTVEELRTTDEAVYPSELADVVQAVLDDTLSTPIRLSGDPDGSAD
jgi:8-oxo-dGTP pyrophosphatase MutT (NUDIX family)